MPDRTRGSAVHHLPPGEQAGDAPPEIRKVEFARRLQAAMADNGLNQSELARKASDYLPGGKTVGKDSISKYIGAVQLPNPERLAAIAKALGTTPQDLMPIRTVHGKDAPPPVDLRQLDNGQVWLRINQEVPWPDAVKILAILKGNA